MILCFIGLVSLLRCRWLQYHVIAMLTGELFTAFFAVWTVHNTRSTDKRGVLNRVAANITRFGLYSLYAHAGKKDVGARGIG